MLWIPTPLPNDTRTLTQTVRKCQYPPLVFIMRLNPNPYEGDKEFLHCLHVLNHVTKINRQPSKKFGVTWVRFRQKLVSD